MKKIITAITLAIALIAAPVCYRLFANKSLTSKKGFSVSAHVLKTQQECGEAFGKNGKNLIRKKESRSIYPVKVDITNNTVEKKQLALQKANIELASEKTVSRRIHNLRLWKVALVGTGIFAAAVVIGCGAGLAWAACIPCASGPTPGLAKALHGILLGGLGICVGGATGLVAAPAAILIFEPKFRKRNKQTKNKVFDYQKLTIEPGQTQTLYLFVEHKNFQENIELTFKDGNGNEEIFSCHVSLL